MRIGYIHAMKGSLIAVLVFTGAAMLNPGAGDSPHIELLLTVSTFLFAILAGFYLSRINQRYDLVRGLLAEEDADWLTFYESSNFFEPKLREEVRELLDEYYIRTMDTDTMDYYKRTRVIFKKVHGALHRAKPVDFPVITYMVELLANIEKTRNQISVIAAEKLRKGQWLTLIILSLIILFCLFYLQKPFIYSHVITILLSTVLVMVLLVMRDLANFRLGGELVAIESGQEMFELINKNRYYHEKLLKDGSVSIPKHIKKYRVGTHTPGAKELVIRFVDVE
ncbi:hypothetical protein COU77_03990 [Candidatus Peregrinibacteria bacterium CG10_big_fil_rev_8_21_14_0_10_49_16]|nr:MAG: hypothetical protein COW95_00050 [Candidatus Peregrinibacteria bacterium CG22_combo_CG10-13_8_21_14_all_49_11]PIR51755.1 MAG: hypothetical protein COU77_03990 [Candidatus Peregrinibacteria bacterium CG10_big_fil_rev_8_21_14_0_10_49_16]